MAEPATNPPIVAHGDPDDHLRLTVLLAKRLGATKPHPCLDPRAAWPKRLRGLQNLLLERAATKAPLVLVDPDALNVRPASNDLEVWEDASFRHQRGDLLDVLLGDVRRGGWTVLRPEPSAALTQRASDLMPEPSEVPEADGEWSVGVSPALAPIGQALVERRTMDAFELGETLQRSEDPDRLLLVMGYEALASDARDAARRLAVPRGAQPLNGVAGPYQVSSDDVPRHCVEQLIRAAWIRSPAPGSYSMARSVRTFLRERAVAAAPGAHRLDHAQAAKGAVHDVLERHHHAIAAEDESLALESSVFYGADLRGLARVRSVRDRDYAGAARLYRAILDRFDRDDAYAHEYLAYNLERADAHAHRDEILSAYGRACELDKLNPLYRGRWLAFRARIGERIATDANRYIRTFMGPSFPESAVSFLAERVLRALRELDDQAQLDEIVRAWGGRLRKYPNLRPLLAR